MVAVQQYDSKILGGKKTERERELYKTVLFLTCVSVKGLARSSSL